MLPQSELLCTGCGSSAVCPMVWAPDGPHAWAIEVRCGECGTWAELGLTNAQAAHLDVVLDRQTRLMHAAVERLAHERVAYDS
jgi:uncharacterized Zn finger protein